MTLTGDWRSILDRHGFEIALLPMDWPLRAVLEQDNRWQMVGSDKVSVLFVRRTAVSPNPLTGAGEDRAAAGMSGVRNTRREVLTNGD
jgi:hypothetical protein